ncbi:outer membrane protein assembly factor BamA [Planctomycetota bacterium]
MFRSDIKSTLGLVMFFFLIIAWGQVLAGGSSEEVALEEAQAITPSASAETVSGDEADKQIIKGIELVGLKYSNPLMIQSKMQSARDSGYDREVLQKDIRRLFATGLFAKIDWRVVPLEDGVKIILEFKENEIVEDIKFAGFKAIPPKTIKSLLSLKVNGPFDQSMINADINSIKEQYLEKGYLFADVTVDIQQGLQGKFVIYIVREGPRVTVKAIKFTGVKAFPPKRVLLVFPKRPLLGRMNTKRNRWWTSSVYQEDELMLDLERLKSFYRSEGWLDVNVFVEDLIFNEIRDKVTIIIHVDEGKRYQIRSIKIAGNKAIESDEVLDKLKVKEGKFYQLKPIMRDLQKVKAMFADLGYVDCRVEPLLVYYPEDGLIDLTYQVDEDKPKYMERLIIKGNDKTRDRVIRQRMAIIPGQKLKYGKIAKSINRLAGTMYFKTINYELDEGLLPDTKNLTLLLEEGQSGMMRLGGGYSSSHGFGGMLELSQSNFDIARLPKSFEDFFSGRCFAGGGQKFRSYWQPGVWRSSYGVSFAEPYLFLKPLEFSTNFFGWDRTWNDYDERHTGRGFGLTRRFEGSGLQIGARHRFESIRISNVESDAPITVFGLVGSNKLRSVTGIIGLDKRNEFLVPSAGYKLSLSYEHAGGFVGGNLDFVKSVFKASKYQTLLSTSAKKKLILQIEGKMGRAHEFGDLNEMPVFERFYAGGFGTVRGFDYRTISPKENTLEVGGNVLSVFNVELTHPLYSEEMQGRHMDIIRGVVFFDAGNVVDKFSHLKWDTYRTSVGFGLRFQLGMLPVELSVGYPIKKEDGDDLERIQLELGYNF